MKKIFMLLVFYIFSLSINIIFSQKTCEEIVKSKIDEEKMISDVESNMLEIKKDSDK